MPSPLRSQSSLASLRRLKSTTKPELFICISTYQHICCPSFTPAFARHGTSGTETRRYRYFAPMRASIIQQMGVFHQYTPLSRLVKNAQM